MLIEWLLRGISVLLWLVSSALIVLMILTLRRERPLAWYTPLLGLLLAPLVYWAYVVLLGVIMTWWLSLPLALLGLLIGVGTGFLSRLRQVGGQVYSRRSWWYLALWGFSFIVAQGLAIAAANKFVSGALLSLTFTTGVAIGYNGTLLVRYRLTRSGASPTTPRVVPSAPA